MKSDSNVFRIKYQDTIVKAAQEIMSKKKESSSIELIGHVFAVLAKSWVHNRRVGDKDQAKSILSIALDYASS